MILAVRHVAWFATSGAPAPRTAVRDRVSGDLAASSFQPQQQVLQNITTAPHRVGTAEHDGFATISSIGLRKSGFDEVHVQAATGFQHAAGTIGGHGRERGWAVSAARAKDRPLLLSAHYDAVPTFVRWLATTASRLPRFSERWRAWRTVRRWPVT